MQRTDDLRDWIALGFVTGVGSRTATLLLDQFGSPSECFRASSYALERAGLKREIIDQLKREPPYDRAEQELFQLEKLGGIALPIVDPRYPSLLQEIYDPPIVLYTIGDVTRAFSQPTIAIVGSRKCSTYGKNAAEMLARELAARGVTIISGLARGIDSASHKGALDANGCTVAVEGTGLDTVYPKENIRLAQKIKENGVLISELPLATPPLPQHFPFRNRIISGLSLGVMIVEGAERSGSLITARLAIEQNREVFAVPGNITSSKSFGPNYLIKDGAKLVQTWRDVVEEFPLVDKEKIFTTEDQVEKAEQLHLPSLVLTANEQRVLARVGFDEPIHIDELSMATKLEVGELLTAITNLEMANQIRQLPGKYFARKL